MSYFSRISIKADALATLSESLCSGDAYRDHALMWRLFPDAPDAPRDFLFRAEGGSNGVLRYFLQSARLPVSWHPSVKVESKPYQPLLSAGEWVHFSLRANPVIAVSPVHDQRGQRHDVLMHAKKTAKQAGLSGVELQAAIDQAAMVWLTKRAENWGLKIDPEDILIDAYQQHHLRNKGRSLRYSSVDYQGVATVTEPDRLAQTLLGHPPQGGLGGLGHALAFGCGLLLVKRLP